MVEHAQDQRLQDDALAERAADGQHRAAGEVEVALGIGVDVAAEPEVPQVRRALVADDALLLEPRDLGGIEREGLDEGEEAPEPGEHAVPPAFGEPPREHLEHRAVVRRAVPHPGVEHGELVAIGQQAGPIGHDNAPCCSHSDYNTVRFRGRPPASHLDHRVAPLACLRG